MPLIPKLFAFLEPIQSSETATNNHRTIFHIMATFQSLTDPLSLYRFSVTNGIPPILSTTTSPSDATTDIKDAKYLIFTPPPSEAAASPKSFPLDYQTRFSTKDATAPGPVDLRTVHFAWINKDRAIPEYVASAAALGEGLIKNLVFMERLELFGWLEGVQETSEFITPLEGDAPKAAGGTAAAPGRVQEPAATGTREMVVEPRLLEIYSQERPIGDRNTMLRGEKPIVRQSRICSRSLLTMTRTFHMCEATAINS